MSWEEKLNEQKQVLDELYITVGKSGHGKLTVIFNQANGKIEIVPEMYIRGLDDFENLKRNMK